VAVVQELFDLSGRVALVTGGSRGLGKEIAEGLAEAGCSLMILARREQWLSPTLDEFRARGFRCEGTLCDVAREEEIDSVVGRTIESFGRLDILVNNAGITWGEPAEKHSIDKWRQVIDVDLTGAFLFAQRAARHMIEARYGNIINVASIAGLVGTLPEGQHIAAYVAAKGGLIALTRELGAKWAQYGIRVNAIAPGFFPSRMTEKVLEAAERQIQAQVPMRRIGREGELKGVAVFLASAASGYITGQTIVVDGGTTIV
jgi:gluconate 5-dehydrogenase